MIDPHDSSLYHPSLNKQYSECEIERYRTCFFIQKYIEISKSNDKINMSQRRNRSEKIVNNTLAANELFDNATIELSEVWGVINATSVNMVKKETEEEPIIDEEQLDEENSGENIEVVEE